MIALVIYWAILVEVLLAWKEWNICGLEKETKSNYGYEDLGDPRREKYGKSCVGRHEADIGYKSLEALD